ncbi:hypothetical protein AOC36_04190 [Erysipelothrix larvae]|uniref:CopG family transcriptional regulator n=1 Tax=Erysipelothrix larvae TaxID=1514105 RepID=A0A0X8GZF8_9FIRM|nr:DUF6290 family protein [Erysipelothrix larvae]AMC93199.1 hypothetical protein AOC36_04190 [Erysipelothrix larvae]
MKTGVSVSLRLSKKDSELIRNFADLKGISVSEFLRDAALKQVFNEITELEYAEAKERYQTEHKSYNSIELREALGLQK